MKLLSSRTPRALRLKLRCRREIANHHRGQAKISTGSPKNDQTTSTKTSIWKLKTLPISIRHKRLDLPGFKELDRARSLMRSSTTKKWSNWSNTRTCRRSSTTKSRLIKFEMLIVKSKREKARVKSHSIRHQRKIHSLSPNFHLATSPKTFKSNWTSRPSRLRGSKKNQPSKRAKTKISILHNRTDRNLTLTGSIRMMKV